MIRNNLLRSFRKFARNSLNYFHQNTSANLLNQSLNLTTIKSILIFLTMTRDSESVESWTARLLKSIASKRVFLISFNASFNVKNADISWNIKTEEQLRQWVHDQSNEIIKMLNKLRSQRDMTLKLNEQWIIVQVEHDKRLNQLEVKQMIIDTLKETNKRY